MGQDERRSRISGMMFKLFMRLVANLESSSIRSQANTGIRLQIESERRKT